MIPPFVSIIVPAYNAKATMALCIESLLNLDYPKDKYEIIIVDNNSKDNTAEIIKNYPVKYLLEDKIQTSYAARNTGIRYSKGEIIAFTDSDCIADKNWIKEGVKSFSDPAVGGVGGRILPYKPETYIEKYQAQNNTFNPEKSIEQKKIITANVFYLKHIIKEIGLFDPLMISGGDMDLSIKVASKYKICYNHKSIVFHKHRTTLGSLWEQFYRYGMSDALLRQKYCCNADAKALRDKYGYIKPLYWHILLVIKCFFGMLKKMFLFSISLQEKRKIQFLNSSLIFVEKTASFFGAVKATIKFKVPTYYYFPLEIDNK